MTQMLNGIELGPDSPMLTRAGVRRRFGPSEAESQIALLELLVGPAQKSERRTAGAGMTGRFPELALVYAINPNKGGNNQVAARGIAKAMGQLQDMPDLHLPVMRGPFIGLYVEMKREGSYGTKAQRALGDALRAQGHCVVECEGTQHALDTFLAYLDLPPNRPSARPIANNAMIAGATLVERLEEWRRRFMASVTRFRPRGGPRA